LADSFGKQNIIAGRRDWRTIKLYAEHRAFARLTANNSCATGLTVDEERRLAQNPNLGGQKNESRKNMNTTVSNSKSTEIQQEHAERAEELQEIASQRLCFKFSADSATSCSSVSALVLFDLQGIHADSF